MKKHILASIFILVFTILSTGVLASPQMPDYIIIAKDTFATYNLILERYLQTHDTAATETLFGLSFRDGSSLNCWRGYQAVYKVDGDSLFLVGIIQCGELRGGQVNNSASFKKMKTIFDARLINDRVFIDWFSGDLNFPRSKEVLRWDGVFYKIYEKETVVNITNGMVCKVEDVENYDDDRKRIDRRNKSKVSDIIFRKLKKAKWKNVGEFDCSEKYVVTIAENGNISKVRMLYTDEEINEYYEEDEYNFCVTRMYETLKALKFDIIKDKGKPISEDIYIEIWIEDNGKIENWTN
jgi:hypothetical protein